MTTLLWDVAWVLLLTLALRGAMAAVKVFLFMLAVAATTDVGFNWLMEVLW